MQLVSEFNVDKDNARGDQTFDFDFKTKAGLVYHHDYDLGQAPRHVNPAPPTKAVSSP